MFKIGDKVRYVQLPEDHEEYLGMDAPKGVGIIVGDYGNILPWRVDFGNSKSWPMLTEELELVNG